MSRGEERIPLASLDPQQLSSHRERLQGELQRLAEASQALQRLCNTFGQSERAIETLSRSKEGHPILLPLTSSLYVPGSVASTDKVLVDIGTGYLVEMTTADGMSHCKRKISKLTAQVQGVAQEIRMKNSQVQQINAVLQEKMMRQQAAAAQQQQALAPAQA